MVSTLAASMMSVRNLEITRCKAAISSGAASSSGDALRRPGLRSTLVLFCKHNHTGFRFYIQELVQGHAYDESF